MKTLFYMFNIVKWAFANTCTVVVLCALMPDNVLFCRREGVQTIPSPIQIKIFEYAIRRNLVDVLF